MPVLLSDKYVSNGVDSSVDRHEKDLQAIATSPTRENPGSNREERIQPVVAWVHLHLAGPLPLEGAAKAAHITRAAFSRFFHRETGKTYSRNVNEVRCSAACLSLKSTDKPSALIAEECGFSTLSNFNRQLLARTGTTPSHYRKPV